jgi:hypothetical protein
MFPLVPGKGISLASKLGVSLATRKKNEAGRFTHPTSNPSKALPDSPGRAARKLSE